MSTFERRPKPRARPVAQTAAAPQAGAAAVLARSARMAAQARLSEAVNASARVTLQRQAAAGLDSAHRELAILNAGTALQEEDDKK